MNDKKRKFNHVKKKMLKTLTVLLILSSFFALSSCTHTNNLFISENNGLKTASFFAMDTIITISAHGKNAEKAIYAAYDEIARMDKEFSAHNDQGELGSIINDLQVDSCLSVSDDLAFMVETANRVSEMSDGALDITVLPLVKLWGFFDRTYTIPEKQDISDALLNVGYRHISIQNDILCLKHDVQIDLGAIAKGYAGQTASDVMDGYGVKGAILSLGGNMQMSGIKPDGSVWNIGIQDPKDENGIVCIISKTDCSIITSGAYQRYFEKDGKIYHHILDPHTGYPAGSDLLSVSIIADEGTYADSLSTALFVSGLQKSIDIWNEYRDFDAVFVTKDNKVFYTSGISDIIKHFSSDYTFECIYPY